MKINEIIQGLNSEDRSLVNKIISVYNGVNEPDIDYSNIIFCDHLGGNCIMQKINETDKMLLMKIDIKEDQSFITPNIEIFYMNEEGEPVLKQ